MLALDRQSEHFPPTGGTTAEGIGNQLGRPHMDRLEILVREAVQNSWDARALSDASIQFGISCWTATPSQRRVLLEKVFAASAPGMRLREGLSADPLRLLVVYDRGTKGMGGQTRADVPSARGEPTDFVDFFRNVGQPSVTEMRGGTYGFGKTAFYLASRVRAICVHTRCRQGSAIESRFMAAGLGPPAAVVNEGRQRRLTGRHWWGRLSTDGIVDPLINADADAVAAALNLPEYPPNGCGTTILIPMPEFGEREPVGAMEVMKRAVLRFFWPKQMDGSDGSATIAFQLALEGELLPVPHPQDVAELRGFVQAFAALRGREASTIPVVRSERQAVVCLRPAQMLGSLMLIQYMLHGPNLESPNGGEPESTEDPFAGQCHHAALMRTPNFVVRYLSGPPMPSSHAEYAAVFQADQAVDRVFAEAEPPTHDDWVPDSLSEARERTFIRVALRRIRAALNEFAAAPNLDTSTGSSVPLGALSDQLAGLIGAEVGTGARIQPAEGEEKPSGGAGSGRARQRTARVAVVGGRTEIVRGVPALVVDFEIDHRGTSEALVSVDAGVTLQGDTTETDPPAGAEQPRVLEWRGPSGMLFDGGATLAIPADSGGRWSVAVSIPSDAKISASVRVEKPTP